VEEIAPPIAHHHHRSLANQQKTKDYVARRLAEGHSKLDAIRALKRYLAREVFTLITQRQKEINATRIAA
jgi:transposase